MSFIGSEVAESNAATSLTVSIPAGTIDGKGMYAFCYCDATDGAVLWSAIGWDEIEQYTEVGARDKSIALFKRTALSEGATQLFSHNGGATQCSASISSYDETEFDVVYSRALHYLYDASEPPTCPDITTVTDGARVVVFGCSTHNTITAAGAPVGYSLRSSVVGQQDRQQFVADVVKTTAGLESPGDWGHTYSATTASSSSIVIAIKESAGEPPAPERVGVIYWGGVEDGSVNNSGGDDDWSLELHPDEPYRSQTFSVVSSPAPRAGSYCMRFYIDSAWPQWTANGTYRSEFGYPGNTHLTDGNKYFIGMSIYIADNVNNRNMIASKKTNCSIMQFHDVGARPTCQLMARDSKWEFSFGDYTKEWCGDIVLGQWNDFVLEVFVSSASDGYCKMWINAASDAETPAYQDFGRNLRVGVTALNPKIGIYRNWINGDITTGPYTYVEQYYDEYRIGDATSNFFSVMPGEVSTGSLGNSAITLDGISLSSGAVIDIEGSAGITLDDVLLVAFAGDPITASANIALDGTTVDAYASDGVFVAKINDVVMK